MEGYSGAPVFKKVFVDNELVDAVVRLLS